MAAVAWAFGFQPYGPVLRARWYAVKTSNDIHYFHGDVVGAIANHYLTPMGYLPGVYETAVIDGLDNLFGAILSIADHDGNPILFIDLDTTGDGVIAGMVLVADHPEQQYIAREDFHDGAAIDILADSSKNADIVSAGDCDGWETSGRSKQMIDSSTIAEAAARQVKLYGPHPLDTDLVGDDTPGTSEDEGCRWICKINEHYHNMPGTSGGYSAASA